MKRKSLSEQWEGLSGFWKLLYGIFFLCMPWTFLLVLAGFWHLDDRISDLEKSPSEIKKYQEF